MALNICCPCMETFVSVLFRRVLCCATDFLPIGPCFDVDRESMSNFLVFGVRNSITFYKTIDG